MFVLSTLFIPQVSAAGTELLDDPKFQNGIAVGYANTYPNSADQTCIDRWKQILPSYNSAKWTFIEISERFYY